MFPAHSPRTYKTYTFTYLEWNVESVFHFKPVGLVFFSVTKICHTETKNFIDSPALKLQGNISTLYKIKYLESVTEGDGKI